MIQPWDRERRRQERRDRADMRAVLRDINDVIEPMVRRYWDNDRQKSITDKVFPDFAGGAGIWRWGESPD